MFPAGVSNNKYKQTMRTILALLSVTVCYFSAVTSVTISNEDRYHNTVRRRSKVQVCTAPSNGICQYCDCYEGDCNVGPNERKVNQFYRGLFVSRKEFQEMLQMGKKHSKVGTISKYRSILSYSFTTSSRQCCDTITTLIEPIEILVNGVTRQVVKADGSNNLQSNQTVEIGRCPRCGSSPCACGPSGHGHCVEEHFLHHVLVYSTNSNVKYEFVWYEYSRFCRCQHS